MYKRILLAYDGSESGQRALLDCQEIAQLNHSELFLIAVMPLTTAYVGFEGGVYESSVDEREQIKLKYDGILADVPRALADDLQELGERPGDTSELRRLAGTFRLGPMA